MANEIKKSSITSQKEDFSKWYHDVVREADLAENSDVRGCGIVKPYGYKIWELIKAELSKRIESKGVENAYFPIFIPINNLETEKEHIEGFSPELAIVSHGGGEELAEPLAVRPTSETSMYQAYSRWIESYQDLPLRLNQWNNVVRWEKRPRPFLRWSEFLWQEGHTAFANEEDAIDEVWEMLDMYEELYKFMAIPVFKGKKSEMEKFAGAEMTTTVEVMARDGKAIQGATSHYLGTNFSKAFDIKYLGKDEQKHFVHQNSWGLSWRSIGVLIMAHGDDNGLRLPPNVAPIQIVVTPIYKDNNKKKVLDYSNEIFNKLKEQYRVKIDERDSVSPGFKFNYWEIRGVPVRLEIGEKEVDENILTIFRRDLNKRESLESGNLDESLKDIFSDIQKNLFDQADSFMNNNINRIESIDDIKDKTGFFEASWSEDSDSEKLLKEKYSMVSRVLPKENESKDPKNKKCFITGKLAKHDWLFAKSY